MSEIVTVTAPMNMAVIKYWGKRDEDLILPFTDTVSATLDTNVMCAKTSVCARPDIPQNEMWLNGEQTSFSNKRLQNTLNEIKAIAKSQQSVNEEFLSWHVRICSVNNFPTAAGLASSAAGYAGLVAALSKLYKIKADISKIARLGSGSACRSVYGGFVRWHAGVNPDGSDSISTQVADSAHWKEMRALIVVVADWEKHISSTKAMKCTVETSELFKYRVEYCVPKRAEEMCKAIKEKNFPAFAELTMKDSNSFHAVCQDTYPPCVYMNDTSHKIANLVHKYNEFSKEIRVAYTYDAGPNACLYLLEKDVPVVIALLKHIFPSSNEQFVRGMSAKEEHNDELLKSFPVPFEKDLVKYLIYTKVGDGPKEINDGSHLLDKNGRLI